MKRDPEGPVEVTGRKIKRRRTRKEEGLENYILTGSESVTRRREEVDLSESKYRNPW